MNPSTVASHPSKPIILKAHRRRGDQFRLNCLFTGFENGPKRQAICLAMGTMVTPEMMERPQEALFAEAKNDGGNNIMGEEATKKWHLAFLLESSPLQDLRDFYIPLQNPSEFNGNFDVHNPLNNLNNTILPSQNT